VAETITVLLVDDERRFRETSRRLLQGRGFDVVLAENGRIALERLSKTPVDLILLDLKMPVMGGEEFLDAATIRYPGIPVIIMTGHGTLDSAVACMKKGAYDFITKPFELEHLVLAMERALEKRNLEQKAREYQEEIVRNLLDLNTQKNRLETIFNCMADGIMVTDKNLQIVLHNPALWRLLDLPGPADASLFAGEIIEDPSFIETLKRMQEKGSNQREIVSQEIQVGGKTLRAITAPNLEPDRHVFWTVSGAVTVLEDITAFKQLDQMKSDFVNMVAHELRSPLVSIRQLHSVLAEGLAGPLQEKQEDFVKRGIKKIDALLGLINDLLDVARLEAGRLVQRQVPTDLGAIIEEMAALTTPRAKERGITLTYSCENLRPILADPKNMEEILNNLLSNALNYSPGGGEVKISAKGIGDFVELKVSDEGIGIPPEEMPKIFEKFYRVKDPKTRQVTGTGLGLSIVKGIVEAHRGSVEVQSAVNEGTTFRILLPMMKEEAH
jgi:two-component system, OmpR family, phosphate regulon sensor histidine kinase PhoR